MPLIAGGGIPQTRAANNGRIRYEHPFKELVAKFCGGVLALSAGLSLGREGPSVQIGSYIGHLISRLGRYPRKGNGNNCWLPEPVRACLPLCRSVVFFFAGNRIHRAF